MIKHRNPPQPDTQAITDAGADIDARAQRIAMLRRLVEQMRAITADGENRYVVAPVAGSFNRAYGGQSLAEAMLAAARTVEPGRLMNSAHCYFLRLGDPAAPTTYTVERLRDTRNFSVRLVRAEQAGQAIISATFSFAGASGGIAHQWAMPPSPSPASVLPRDLDLLQRYHGNPPTNAGVPWPVDIRYLDHRPWDQQAGDARHRSWMRVDEALPDDPALHAAILLYASDLTMFEAVTARHPIVWEDLITAKGMFGASLDHAVWLHSAVRIDDWLLHVQESSRAADGRGFITGRFFDQSGTLVASVAQEIFIKQV